MKKILYALFAVSLFGSTARGALLRGDTRTRVIITTDGEIDDECSMVRCLLYANEWDIEAIITTSSQYHWHGHRWAGDDWLDPVLDAYGKVYPNLLLHDVNYPSPDTLRARNYLGNVTDQDEMEQETAGSEAIVRILLDTSDPRPVWVQAWGGTNTLARALKSIEERWPERMSEVASKLRLFLIWEQDRTYQGYIRPHWGRYGILTIISDQFEAIAYRWRMAQPAAMHRYFDGSWMREHILEGHGALCAAYKAHENGDFRSEGDSPAFLYTIPTGMQHLDHPDWGGWGGRYVRVRENTWLDPVPDPSYVYPEGRWWGENGWGRSSLRPGSPVSEALRHEYFRSMWRWSPAFQNDFAARADWCVKTFEEANHAPQVKVNQPMQLEVHPGERVKLDARQSRDPDGDSLHFHWWNYREAGTYAGSVEIPDAEQARTSVVVPGDALPGDTIHLICEVSDDGIPTLTRYARIVLQIHE